MSEIETTNNSRGKTKRTPRPLPEGAVDHGIRYSIAQKIQALTLFTEGFTTAAIERKTGVPPQTARRIRKTAELRGYRPKEDPRILEAYVEDAPKSGRPVVITEEVEVNLLAEVRADRAGREKSSEVLAYGAGISRTSALRILHKYGLTNVKPTRKPGLTAKIKAARLRFCQDYAHWSLDDWKNVIWTDETSVLLGHRRGSVRIWRDSHEAYEKSVVRNRWKGFSEFMFWGSFTWYEKGPCHIWCRETKAERSINDEYLAHLNTILEATKREEWELNTAMQRLHATRNQGGSKPKWRWTKANGKLVRDSNGGIDWFLYWTVILLPKLIPYAQECARKRPGTIPLVQEDGAPAHAHSSQAAVFSLAGVSRLLWPGNSPDLNAIEPTWFWLKRRTTALGAATSRKEMETRWYQGWDDLPQETIRSFIERIPHHIQSIIALDGGNEYEEGIPGFKRSWKGDRIKGKLLRTAKTGGLGTGS